MKTLLSATIILGASVGSAFAGSYVAPPVETVTIDTPAPQNDWGGFYLGGMYTFENESWKQYLNGVNNLNWTPNRNAIGAFAGYNVQKNNLVFGGELAYSYIKATGMNGVTAAAVDDSFLDVKARVGYARGNVLFYGFGGASTLLAWSSIGPTPISGFNYGVGAEVKFGGGLFVGAEYMSRNLRNDAWDPALGLGLDYAAQVVALRAGWQF